MKGTSELKSRLDGEIKEVNSKLQEDPEELNENKKPPVKEWF